MSKYADRLHEYVPHLKKKRLEISLFSNVHSFKSKLVDHICFEEMFVCCLDSAMENGDVYNILNEFYIQLSAIFVLWGGVER